jgi:periplasmic protein CpxP/Spy
MRIPFALSAAAVASLLFAAPVFAEPAPMAPQAAPSEGHGGGRHHGRGGHKLERRLERAVENGRLTRAQADQFLAEAQQIRADAHAQRQAAGCQLNPDQKAQFKQRRQALREKVRTALVATRPQGQ